MEDKPWIRVNKKGEKEKFEDQKWMVIPKNETMKIPKMEAQIWLAIYNMFLCQETNRKYEVTEHRKNNLCRLRKFMNEVLLDQIPCLVNLQRALDELSLQ